MENIKYEDVEAFVRRAIELNVPMKSQFGTIIINGDVTLTLDKQDGNVHMKIHLSDLNSIDFIITELEAAKYKVLYQEVREHSINKAIGRFFKYFDNSKDTTITNIDYLD